MQKLVLLRLNLNFRIVEMKIIFFSVKICLKRQINTDDIVVLN